MGKGIAGFGRVRTGLQNIKSHRSAHRLADVDIVEVCDRHAINDEAVLHSHLFGDRMLSVPLSARFDFDTVAEIGDQLKAGIDPIIKVTEKMELR